MSERTVHWPAPRSPGSQAALAESLRERKKRLMRQQLSDTATEMFLARGFDGVRVADIAEACGVSEKTVFNYFPTKESLILDRWDSTSAALRTALADPAQPPVEAALGILADELTAVTSWLAAQEDLAEAAGQIQRFGALINSTAALRAHQCDIADRLTAEAADILAARTGMSHDDPEPQIAAAALIALWTIQARSLARHLTGPASPPQLHKAVTADVQRAAQVISLGLSSFTGFTAGNPGSGTSLAEAATAGGDRARRR
jgi:AcrR family transcriptional regulator